MSRRGGGVLIVCGALALAACDSGPDDAAATTAVASVASTSSSTTSTTSTSSSSSTSTTPTTTSTTMTATTTTTTTTTTSTEPAQSRQSSTLPRPTGYARFEPGPALDGVAAFTGLPAGPQVTARPALAVKIDNAEGGPPHWNLADADLVFEENVEGITRFVAVYQTNMPDRIGPVRSARTSDIDILSSLNRPVLAWSGGNANVTSAVRGAHEYGWLSNLSAQSSGCFWRSATRQAPHNLLLDPACARASATLAGPARPVFEHAAATPAGGAVERQFTVKMSGLVVTWIWNAELDRYERRQRGDWHTDVDGTRVGAENVVELVVRYVPSPADERSPEAITVGSGPAVVHRDGRAIDAHWARADRLAPFTLTDDAGAPIGLSTGTTFVELRR